MTELERAIADLPDTATVPVGWVRKKMRVRSEVEHPEILSTRQAAERLGYSRKRWASWCVAGQIEGAWQDSDDGHWRMPLASCRAHLDSLRSRSTRKRSAFRGGYAEAQEPPARQARPTLVQAR